MRPEPGRQPTGEKKMGLYCDEKAGDKFIDGTINCVAVLHKDSNHIEVWDEDCEQHFGNLPANSTAEHINAAVRFYRAGEAAGHKAGAASKQAEVRAALGIS